VTHRAVTHRKTPASARGESMVWLTGLALVLAIAMVVALLSIIGYQGIRTFWPKPIERVTLTDGTVLLGEQVETAPFDPSGAEGEAFEAVRGALPDDAVDEEGRPLRTLYRVGNRDLGSPTFRWVPRWSIVETERPDDALLVERRTWGVWIGTFAGLENGDGSVEPATLDEFRERHAEAVELRERAEDLTEHELGRINRKVEAARLDVRRAEIEAERSDPDRGMPIALWLVTLGVALAGLVVATRGAGGGAMGVWVRGTAIAAFIACGLGAVLEHPWSGRDLGEAYVEQVRAESAEQVASLRERAAVLESRISEFREAARESRAVFLAADGQTRAPDRDGGSGRALPASAVVRVVESNSLDFWGKLSVFGSRWWEFVSAEPRESNTDGGVMPVIFGTVTLTLLLTIAVVPLGVIAAIYLREYARQGTMTSLIRIAVNNLAGVPSIVYGVFGLGFFCYGVGGFIDAGPASPMERGSGWWGLLVIAVVLVSAGAGVGLLLGTSAEKAKWRRRIAWTAWAGAALLAVYLIVRTPYFGGLFPERLPTPTYGGRGLLWASLTLALLTLPVVIVATEEAIAAVPGSMREGSYGCGASKWQTVRRIVLPAAAPGVMTGAILAVARGAGEVAPLMIVGAVKSAPELPISSQPPFIHPERSFMHLGFHIYDLGFQSPDSEAARPLLWTTTLLLLGIVLVLNLTAIVVRARLRTKAGGSVV